MGTRSTSWKPWAGVAIWIGVLGLESSDLGSSEHTGKLLRRIWMAVAGTVNEHTFHMVHHAIRKTGHFAGYAILSYLIFLALRSGWRNRQRILQRGREYFWQLRWSMVSMAGTVAAASLDEIHQSFNRARTARWQDVVIDSCGALTIQFLVYLVTLMRRGNATASA